MTALSRPSREVTVAVAAAGAGLALWLAARGIQRRSSRHCAASPFEYHCAVYAPGSPAGGETGWVLVKVPKSADEAALRDATAKALGLGSAEQEALALLPVMRSARGPARLGRDVLGPAGGGVGAFEALLLARPPDQLQVVELVGTAGGATPAPPQPPPRFPQPGAAYPLLGHLMLFSGPQLPAHNFTSAVFPPSAPAYPYGATVSWSNGGTQIKIGDFAEGTVFHRDASVHSMFSADARVAEELISRSADFPKLWNRPYQKNLQDFTGNGLFTSSETSEDWQSGHSILPRGFNQIKVKAFAPQILSKTRAFVKEWSSLPSGHLVKGVNDWLTAMTADAVVACSMGMDMRNVERLGAGEPPHPFVESFRFGLGYAGGTITARREYGLKRFVPFFGAARRMRDRYDFHKKRLEDLVEEIVAATRRGEMGGQNSIIRSMLEDRASSGKHVRYSVLYAHVVNLMIAGHETTAATLGFTMQLLAEHPECEARALDEVRRVLQGRTEPEAEDVPKLQYVEQCFREALRLYSPVNLLTRDAAHDTLLNGHAVFQGSRIAMVTRALHTNPEYWGGSFGDPLTFNPDRFSPEAVAARHPNAYAPWGFATRACIGSQFALFEAKTFLASMLVHFKWVGVPGYKLKASLEAGGAAASPHDLAFYVYPRPGGPCCEPNGSMKALAPLGVPQAPLQPPAAEVASLCALAPLPAGGPKPVMKVLYGSNSGASQEFASQVAAASRGLGFDASTATLDSAVEEKALVPDGRTVVVVTSTYNGNPPDNAKKFKNWLQGQQPGSLTGLRFATFGLGNSQWHTYQQFPKEVDAGLLRCGAQRLFDLGTCDVDGPSFESDFEEWLEALMRVVGGASLRSSPVEAVEDKNAQEFVMRGPGEPFDGPLYTSSRDLFLEMEKARTRVMKDNPALENDFKFHLIEAAEASRELCQKPGDGRSVRHATLRLSEMAGEYRAGDHLEVLPPNATELVMMALDAVGLPPQAEVIWDSSLGHRIKGMTADLRQKKGLRSLMPKFLVTAELFMQWVPDLAAVPSKKTVGWLAGKLTQESACQQLRALEADAKAYGEKVASPKLSLAELLQQHKGAWNLTIGELAAHVKLLQSRYYSVSSSPAGAKDKRVVTLSVGQVEFTTGTGRLHKGVASTALGGLAAGDVILGSVRKLSGGFHVPDDLMAPMIMVGPGTGVAPMLGFLQERAQLLRSGKKLGPAVLFFGCRSTAQDYLYREELREHLETGALTELHVAASREGPQKVYVQDVIVEKCEAVWQLLQHPRAAIYVCGDARAMAPDVKRAFQRVAELCGGRSGARAADLVASMVEGERYLEDVWAA
jgi:cytochrome P450/NADPH-cytochrome P450 reductase